MSSNPARNFEIFKTHFFLVVKYVKFECSNYIMYINFDRCPLPPLKVKGQNHTQSVFY